MLERGVLLFLRAGRRVLDRGLCQGRHGERGETARRTETRRAARPWFLIERRRRADGSSAGSGASSPEWDTSVIFGTDRGVGGGGAVED